MIVLHVFERIHADKAPDNARDQDHDQRKAINDKIGMYLYLMGMGELIPVDERRLNEYQQNGQIHPVPDAEDNDHNGENKLYRYHTIIDPFMVHGQFQAAVKIADSNQE